MVRWDSQEEMRKRGCGNEASFLASRALWVRIKLSGFSRRPAVGKNNTRTSLLCTVLILVIFLSSLIILALTSRDAMAGERMAFSAAFFVASMRVVVDVVAFSPS